MYQVLGPVVPRSTSFGRIRHVQITTDDERLFQIKFRGELRALHPARNTVHAVMLALVRATS